MNLSARVTAQFEESILAKQNAASILSEPIAAAIEQAIDCLTDGGKILACGNGGSAADCQHFAAELVGRFERERPGLAAIALTTDTSILTAISNDYSYDEVFSKQIAAIGQPKDILFALSTSGNSRNILLAVEAAKNREMKVIALTGKGGGKLATLLSDNDLHICAPSERTARIQEIHLLTIHCICDGIDLLLLGEENDR